MSELSAIINTALIPIIIKVRLQIELMPTSHYPKPDLKLLQISKLSKQKNTNKLSLVGAGINRKWTYLPAS